LYITLNANIVSFIDYGAIIPQKYLIYWCKLYEDESEVEYI